MKEVKMKCDVHLNGWYLLFISSSGWYLLFISSQGTNSVQLWT